MREPGWRRIFEATNSEVDVQKLKGLAPSIIIGVMGNSVIYLVPLLVGGMVTDRGFTESQAGFMASADLGGYAIATFLTAMLLDRFSWRRMALVGLALMLAANVATTFVHDIQLFALVRIASGLGSGVLAALASVEIGQSKTPDRNYGFLLAASLLYGTVALWGMPVFLTRYGLNSAYWLLVVLAIAVLFVVPSLPEGRAQEHDTAPRIGGLNTWVLSGAVLTAILLFWAEQNDVYAYIERIGNASAIRPEFIGFALGAANLTGFAGASLVALLGTRLGRFVPMLLATIINVGGLLIFSRPVSPWTYMIVLGAMSLSWNAINPFQLGVLANSDPSGKALALAATVTGAGLALGPALGAVAIERGGYSAALAVGGVLALVSFGLTLVPMWAARKVAA